MPYLRALARVLLAAWFLIWVGSVALYVYQAAHRRTAWHAWLIAPAETSRDFPIIRKLFPEFKGEPRAVPGDRIVRIGGEDARGLGMAGVDALAFAHTGPDLRVSLLLERDGQPFEAWSEAITIPRRWKHLPMTLVLGGTALILALRVKRSRAAQLLSATMLAYALVWIPVFGVGPVEQHYAWLGIRILASSLMLPLLLTALLFFPDGRGPESRWSLVWPWAFAFNGVVHAGLWEEWVFRHHTAQMLLLVLYVVVAVLVLALVTQKFRGTDPVGRRQIKWVVYGFYLSAIPHLLGGLLALGHPDPDFRWKISEVAEIPTVFVPLSVLIAMVRFNLFDIDRLISATAAYTVVGIGALAGLLVMLPAASAALENQLGIGTGATQLALSVLAASLTVPMAQRLRPRIERVFFAERHSLEAGVQRLLEELSARQDPRELTALAGEQLDVLLRPDCCVVYARAGPGYEPVFVKGRAVPPAIDGQSPLITALRGRSSPLASDRLSRRDRIEQLSPFDRAALETLGAVVVVPIRRRGELAAFLCLGHKHSGDIYTRTDLALLTAVVNTVATQLERLDQEEIAREARAMQEELRRYVPGAIARGLDAGEDLEPRERAVTVLFVDIRGYTSYSESRRAREIFAMVSDYTKAVSSLVEKSGGSVVEFNGDGMMAVFGAPRSLADKELAAVAAGREIIQSMASVGRLAREAESAPPLSVGVGIATGEAFVGGIQAVDRRIWTALGNTTNRAARLQSLTRELDASMVIDLATWRAAGEEAADLERHEGVSLRGRAAREDVYLLPLPDSVAD